LTNFLEFYLFRDGEIINEVHLANPVFLKLGKRPVPENIDKFNELLDQFFSFSVPETYTAKALATELAKRPRFLSSLILEELNEETEIVLGIYKALKEELIESLTEDSFPHMPCRWRSLADSGAVPETNPHAFRLGIHLENHTWILTFIYRVGQ